MAEQNVQQPKKKKGGKWIAPTIIFGLLTFAIVAPIATLYICFYDGTAKEIEKDESFSASTFLNDKLVAALDTTKDDGQISIKVSENDFNQMLLASKEAVVGAIPTLGKYVSGADLVTGDTQYVFSLNAHLGKIFKSRARVYATLGSEMINGEDCLVFKLNDVKVGRVSFLKTYKKNKLLRQLINDDIVNSFLGGTGFSLKSDLNENDRIYYPKSAITSDISILGEGESSGIYTTLLQEFFHQNMFNLDFNKQGFQGGINLTKAHDNAAFVSPEKANDVDFIHLRDQVQELLNAGVPKDDAQLLYKFFIVGYAKLNEAEQAEMAGFDLSEYGIPDVTTHQGVIIDYAGSETVPGKIVRPEVSIQDYVGHQASSSECDPGDDIAVIEEHELNKTLMSSDTIGTPRVLIHELKDGTYKVNTFSINNMYCNIYSNTVKFAVDLSVNGYDTYICLDTTLSTSNTFVMNFNINDVYYGDMDSSEAFKTEILNLLFTSFQSNALVSFNNETKQFQVDITSQIPEAKKTKVETAGGVDQFVTGDSKADDGTLIFRVHS